MLRHISSLLTYKANVDVEKKLLNSLIEQYSKERKDIHISDLILCLRQSWFRRFKYKPPTPQQITYYVDGYSRHVVLEQLYREGIKEKSGSFKGAKYTIDILDGYPIELKSTRSGKIISNHWFTQLSFYMLCSNSDHGILVILRVNPISTNTPIESYDIYFRNEKAREETLNELEKRINLLSRAISSKSVGIIPRLDSYPRFFPCANCAWLDDCV